MARHRRVHFCRAANVKLLGVKPHPGRVVHRLPGMNAQQDVVRGCVVSSQVVRVACPHQRQTHPGRDLDRAHRAFLLDSHAVVLDLDVEILFAENLLVPRAQSLGFLHLAVQDVIGKLGRRTSRKANQPLRVPLENLLVDPRLVIKPLKKGER